MGAIAGQNCGLKSGWTDKADGWGADVNTDLLIADIFMQPTVIAITQAPQALGRGSAYIVAAGAASLATKTNHIAIYTGSGWVYIPPRIGWTFYVSDDDKYYRWTGSAWEEVLTDVKIASTTAAGLVKPDGVTTVTDSAGTLTAKDIAIGGSLTDTAMARGQVGEASRTIDLDFNNMTKAGVYWYTSDNATNGTNSPSTLGGYLVVYSPTGNYAVQLYYVWNSNTVYQRRMTSSSAGTWTSWSVVLDSSRVGDGIVVTNGIPSVPTLAGATASVAGTKGLVPAPAAGMQNALLGGDAVYHPLSNSVTSTSQTNAASSLAVKTAYDKAAAALPMAGGTMTGNLTVPYVTVLPQDTNLKGGELKLHAANNANYGYVIDTYNNIMRILSVYKTTGSAYKIWNVDPINNELHGVRLSAFGLPNFAGGAVSIGVPTESSKWYAPCDCWVNVRYCVNINVTHNYISINGITASYLAWDSGSNTITNEVLIPVLQGLSVAMLVTTGVGYVRYIPCITISN